LTSQLYTLSLHDALPILRLWPSASSTQTMNTALFDLVEKHQPAFDKIKKVRVSLSQTVYDLHGKLADYKAKFDALISAHYVAARSEEHTSELQSRSDLVC